LGFANNMPPKKALYTPSTGIFKMFERIGRTISSAGGQNNPNFSLFLFDSMEGEKQK